MNPIRQLLAIFVFGASLAGCAEDPTGTDFPPAQEVVRAGGVEWTADSRVAMGDNQTRLVVRAIGRNVTDETLSLSYGACPVRVLLYDEAGRAGRPLWDSEALPYSCPDVRYTRQLAPGDTLHLTAAHPERDLPAGSTRLYVAAVVVADRLPTPPIAAGEVVLDDPAPVGGV